MIRSILIAAIVLASPARVAFADEPTEAEQLYIQGQAAFDANQFDAAVSAWERSYTLSKEPALLFNIGQAYRQRRKSGDCTKSVDAYKKFLELDPASDQRPVAEGYLTELQACVAREAPPPTTAHPQIDTAMPDNGHSKRIVGLAVAVGGIAFVATGIYFGHEASSLGGEVSTACANGCNWADFAGKDADGHRAQSRQWIFDGVGAAALVGGGILYWLGTREHATSTIAVTVHDGATIAWTRAW